MAVSNGRVQGVSASLGVHTDPPAAMRSRQPTDSPAALKPQFDRVISTVFPAARDRPGKRRVVQEREVVSSVPLQTLLYFNVWYSAAFLLVSVPLVRWKILNNREDTLLRYSTPTCYAVWAVAEAYRLYQGYLGNLREQVASLAAFLFLSVFPQALMCGFFFGVQKKVMPVDRVLAIYHALFLAAELVLSYRAMQRVIANNTARFAVEYAIDDGSDDETERRRARAPEPGDDLGATARASVVPAAAASSTGGLGTIRRVMGGGTGRSLAALRARSPKSADAAGAARVEKPTLEVEMAPPRASPERPPADGSDRSRDSSF